jgi:hypothetical protein
VGVATLVVDDGPPASGVLDVALLERGALGRCGLRGELERIECGSRVSSGSLGDESGELFRHVQPEVLCSASNDDREVVVRQWLELVDLRAREKCGIDLEVGVLGGRSDQRDEPGLDRGEQRVLLCLVEPVDLVQEEDRARAACPQPFGGALEDRADVGDRRGDGGELLELRPGRLGHDSRQGRLPAPGRPVEDRRPDPVLGDGERERRPGSDDLLLSDEVVEAARPKPGGQGGHVVEAARAPHRRRDRSRREVCSRDGHDLGARRGDRAPQGLLRANTVNPPGNETRRPSSSAATSRGGRRVRALREVPERANLVARLPGAAGRRSP